MATSTFIDKFKGRANEYDTFRPEYARETISFLEDMITLTDSNIIGDIGSGTGLSSKLFLDNSNTVYGVEPSDDMRNYAENNLSEYENFYSINGISDDTKLEDASLDVIMLGQALHHFPLHSTREEFSRILKPGGHIVLLYNKRGKSSKFMQEYLELIKKYGSKLFAEVSQEYKDEFFKGQSLNEHVIANPYTVDYEALEGNLLSYSYMPKQNDPRFDNMICNLKKLFNRYNEYGQVTLDYETHITYCVFK